MPENRDIAAHNSPRHRSLLPNQVNEVLSSRSSNALRIKPLGPIRINCLAPRLLLEAQAM